MALRPFLTSMFGVGQARQPSRPTQMQGTPGFSVYNGYLREKQTNSALIGQERWRTYSDLLVNISIIAACVRASLNLLGRTEWSVEPAKDINGGESSDEAKRLAEFAESVLHDMASPWAKVVQRAATYQFLGFSTNEWRAKRRDDGAIGLYDIRPRPQWTIERWDIDQNGKLIGVVQRVPQTGAEAYIPRGKLLYVVDDILTDMPDGTGLMRHCVEPGMRLKEYLRNEGLGFERDLRGIPVGRAPYKMLQEQVASGEITQADMDNQLAGLRDIVQLQAKTVTTGVVMDSDPYRSATDTGETPSNVYKWGLELLKGDPKGLDEIGAAVDRLNRELARILGGEHLMLGDGGGSRALGDSKVKNFHLQLEGVMADIADAGERDVLGPVWTLNGFPNELKPTLRYEAVQFKDVEQITAALRDLGAAGAVLAPDDPAIDEVRQLLGLSPQPEMDDEVEELRRTAELAGLEAQITGAEQAAAGEPQGGGEEA